MPLINTSVPNLIQGVSQQPDGNRFAGQCDEQVNAVSSIVRGLKKRPPMQFVGKMFDVNGADYGNAERDQFSKALITFIERDNNERYVLTLRHGNLRIFRIYDNYLVECSISYNTNTFTSGVGFNNTDYLYSLNSDQKIKTLTVGDTTFLVNTEKVVTQNNAELTDDYSNKAIVFLKQADYEKTYTVTVGSGVNANTSSCTTGSSIADNEDNIDDAVANDTPNGSSATSSGAIINVLASGLGAVATVIDKAHMLVTVTDSISVTDDLHGNGMGVVYKEVDSITDLPLVCVNGLVVKVIGDVEINQDDYYVKFETVTKSEVATTGKGSWVETVAPNIPYKIDGNLPMSLVNTAENTFSLEIMALGEREVGDEESNPLPSFVDSTISNVFLFKGRLGFLSEDAIILSEAGLGGIITYNNSDTRQRFNFFRKTVTTLLDSELIDVRVSNRDVTTLRAAQPFQEDLMIFSDSAQFKLAGGDTLTSRNISVSQVTSFDYNKSVEPLCLGAYLYFPFDRGVFSGIREYTVNAVNATFDSEEITQHVPQYIPKNLTSFTGSDAENMIALSSGDIRYLDGEGVYSGSGTFPPFDFAVVRYAWTAANGRDLDTRTRVTSPINTSAVGWNRLSSDTGLTWRGDNVSTTGVEAVLIDYPDIISAAPNPSSLILIPLSAFWYGERANGYFNIEFDTYLGGTMVPVGSFDYQNTGGSIVSNITVGGFSSTDNVQEDIEGDQQYTIVYNPVSKQAYLI